MPLALESSECGKRAAIVHTLKGNFSLRISALFLYCCVGNHTHTTQTHTHTQTHPNYMRVYRDTHTKHKHTQNICTYIYTHTQNTNTYMHTYTIMMFELTQYIF